MTACQRSDVSMAHFLLSHSNLKYNMSNRFGTTALIVAASYGSLEIVELLLSKKDININAVASELPVGTLVGSRHVNSHKISSHVGPVSVLSAAAESGNGKIVKLLLNESRLDRKHLGIALLIAVFWKYKRVVEELLPVIDARVDVNVRDACGNTVLHYATSREDLELAEILLKHPNIKTDIENSSGLTPGRYCKGRWYFELALSRDEKASRKIKGYLGRLIQPVLKTRPLPLPPTNDTTGRLVTSTQALTRTRPIPPAPRGEKKKVEKSRQTPRATRDVGLNVEPRRPGRTTLPI